MMVKRKKGVADGHPLFIARFRSSYPAIRQVERLPHVAQYVLLQILPDQRVGRILAHYVFEHGGRHVHRDVAQLADARVDGASGQIREISPDIFTTAAFALAECVDEADLARGTVYPRISELRSISVHVATAVLKDIVRKDPSHPLIGQDLQQHLLSHMWEPVYLPYRRV